MRPTRIKFVGNKGEAPSHITDGNTHIELPASQDKPFDHPEARRILKVMPELYKPVIGKGREPKVVLETPTDRQTAAVVPPVVPLADQSTESLAPAKCHQPPIGWDCTREPNHSGPCAAVEQLSGAHTEPSSS